MKNRRHRHSRKIIMSNVLMKRTSVSNISDSSSDRWSKLSEDILRLVVDRIVSEKTFIVFRSVCRDWRSAIPRSFWKRTPWLLAKRYKTPMVVLHSLNPSNNSLVSLFETELHWRYWGSFTGWILGQHPNDYRLRLINPLTKAVIDLPKLHHHIRKGLVYHVPGSDTRNPTIGVMAISRSFNGIAMIDDEYKEWTFLPDKNDVYKSDFVDLVWYKDDVAALRADGAIVFYNEARIVRSLDSKHALVGDCYEPYLVESSGELLIVAKCIKVYRLNLDTGEWIVVKSLGRYSLFVGNSYSICRWISEDDTWRPSCIYNATYSSTSSGSLWCYNIIKKRDEFHDLGPVTELSKCYDFIWYMPAVGSNSAIRMSH